MQRDTFANSAGKQKLNNKEPKDPKAELESQFILRLPLVSSF